MIKKVKNQTLIHGEAFEEMEKIVDEKIRFDLILADIPYGTTACKWDSVLPFNNYILGTRTSRSRKLIPLYRDEWVIRELESTHKSIHQCRDEFDDVSKKGMWQYLNELIKPNGAMLLFGSEPFSSALRMSNIKNYKYDWVWNKKTTAGFVNAKLKPLAVYESISVFSEGATANGSERNMPYNPQGLQSFNKVFDKTRKNLEKQMNTVARKNADKNYLQEWTNYPKEIITFSKPNTNIHPTQKPVALIEYLIKTYTNDGDTLLDFTSGSGTTPVAAEKTGRKCTAIELDNGYFDIGVERVKTT